MRSLSELIGWPSYDENTITYIKPFSLSGQLKSLFWYGDIYIMFTTFQENGVIRGVFRNNVDFFNNFAMLCSMVIKII